MLRKNKSLEKNKEGQLSMGWDEMYLDEIPILGAICAKTNIWFQPGAATHSNRAEKDVSPLLSQVCLISQDLFEMVRLILPAVWRCRSGRTSHSGRFLPAAACPPPPISSLQVKPSNNPNGRRWLKILFMFFVAVHSYCKEWQLYSTF